MSLGDMSNNNQPKKYYPTGYSNVIFYNDSASLGFRFVLSGILEIRIVPKNASGQGFDDKNAISIYLSPNKALILSKALELLKNDLKDGIMSNYGVCNNKKTSNIEFGFSKDGDRIDVYCTIYKYNNNGALSDRFSFIFKNEEEYIVKNFSMNDTNYEKIMVHEYPLDSIQNLLDEYVKSMSGASAYAVDYFVGQYKYNVGQLKKMLEGGGNSVPALNGGSNNSIFDQPNNSNMDDDDFPF